MIQTIFPIAKATLFVLGSTTNGGNRVHIFASSCFFFYLVSTLACTIESTNTRARFGFNVLSMSFVIVTSFGEIDSGVVEYWIAKTSVMYSNDSMEGTSALLYLYNLRLLLLVSQLLLLVPCFLHALHSRRRITIFLFFCKGSSTTCNNIQHIESTHCKTDGN